MARRRKKHAAGKEGKVQPVSRTPAARTPTAETPTASSWRVPVIGLAIFAFALLVRLAYLHEVSESPAFEIPVVDSRTYDELARALAAGSAMDQQFFWQPFFYPFFLYLVYALSDVSIVAAKVCQAIVGAVTCLLTYRLGRRIFDRNTGILAGVLTALYGPLIFFEGELVAAGWAAFWAVTLILLFLHAGAKLSLWRCLILGICGTLGVLTRPTFLPFLLGGCVWLIFPWRRAATEWRRVALGLATVAAGGLLCAAPVAVQCWRLTGHLGILPSSGGINFYIGNHPDSCELVTLRPGEEWDRLAQLPRQYGIGDMWEQQDFFYGQTREYLATNPLGYARGLLRKTLQFANSREIPRNVDVYMFRQWSGLQRVLTWKAGGFGFPLGIILPLALLGLLQSWRRVPGPLVIFLLLYPLAVVLVFVTARYRVPVLPALCVLAAAGGLSVVRLVGARRWRPLALAGVPVVGILLLSWLPGPFCEEDQPFEAELYNGMAGRQIRFGQPDQARTFLHEALRWDPENGNAHHNLANLMLLEDQNADAVTHYQAAVRLKPGRASAHASLGIALARLDRHPEAESAYRAALQLEPDDPVVHYNLGRALGAMGRFPEAAAEYHEALRLKPDDTRFRCNLGMALAAMGRDDEGLAQLYQAVNSDPRFVPARMILAQMLRRQGRTDAAIEQLQEALRIDPRNAAARRELEAIRQTTGEREPSAP
ncbi:MAG: tetratricopeptide repeat protein [Planctomycetota bacterium]